MRGSAIFVAMVLIGLAPALAADLSDEGAIPAPRHRAHGRLEVDAYGFGYARRLPPGPYVVAPRPYTLVVPRPAPPPPLHYAPPPVYPEPPPLIAAVPIVGPYLVPREFGPPPATVLDAYDYRFDYNQ